MCNIPLALPHNRCYRCPVANKLAEYLDDEGLSQADFARLAEIKAPLVSMIASGRRGAGLKTAMAIERATGGRIPAEYWDGLRRRPKRAERRVT